MNKRVQILMYCCFFLVTSLSAKGSRDEGLSEGEKTDSEIREFRIIAPPLGETPLFLSSPGDTETLLLCQLFEGLVSINPENGKPEPALAESWEVLDEGRIYRFTLKDLRWSDGSPLNAEDFMISFVNMLDLGPDTPGSFYISRFIKNASLYLRGSGQVEDLGFRVLDRSTLEIEFTRAFPYALNLLAHYAFLLYPEELFQKNPLSYTLLRGGRKSGPYDLSIPEEGTPIMITKNQYRETPGPESIALVEAGDEGVELFLHGKGDWLIHDAFPLSQLHDLDYRIDFDNTSGLTSYYYLLNLQKSPLENRGLRKLLVNSVDRTALVQEVLRGPQIPTWKLIPPSFYNLKESGNPIVEPGVSGAGKSAAFSEGDAVLPLILIYPTDEGHRHVAEALINQWKDTAGIPVEARGLDLLDFTRERQLGNYHIALGGWAGDFNDPLTFLSLFLSAEKSWGQVYRNSEFDDLIMTSETMEAGLDRLDIQHKAESILIDDGVVIPLFFNGHPQLLDRSRWRGAPIKFPGYYTHLKYLYR